MADAEGSTVSTILIVLGLLVLLLIIGSIVFSLRKTATTELCRMSVAAKAAANKATAGTADFLNLNCETDRVTIKNDYVYDNEGKEKISSFSGATKEDKIKRIVAEKGRDCWYEFNRGEFNLEAVFGNVLGGQTCVVCSEILFDSTIHKEVPELLNFSGWLSNKIMDGTKQTYSEYFQNATQVSKLIISGSESVFTNQSYQWIFQVYAVNEHSKISTVSALVLIPSEQANEKCHIYY